MADPFGREGFDSNTGMYRCARCGEETPRNGAVNTCAIVTVLDEDGFTVRNLRLCYVNGCASDVLSTGKLTAMDDRPKFPTPAPDIPQENPGVRPVPVPAADPDPSERPPADVDTSTDTGTDG